MPPMPSIQVEERYVTGKKVRHLRRDNVIPGVIYGQVEAKAVQVDGHTLDRFLADLSASSLINIEVAGEDSPRPAIIRAVQRHPVTQKVEHFDFLQVDLSEKVRVSVPIALVGESPVTIEGVTRVDPETGEEVEEFGILIQGLTTLEVECLPTDIPELIEVDVSVLRNFDESIHVADLIVPEGVEVHSPPDQMVARVITQRPEEEEEEEEEDLLFAPTEEVEVITEERARERREREREEESSEE